MIALLLGALCLALLGLSLRLFYSGMRRAGTERTLERLGRVQDTAPVATVGRDWLDRLLQRAGLERRNDRLLSWLAMWALLSLLVALVLGWSVGVIVVLAGPLLFRLYLGWRYHRRLQRMIEQLPVLLDHSMRSLKSGRTLSDAVLGAIDASREPLHGAMQRVRRNVKMGIGLDDAMQDLAELYDQDELRLFALGLRINHRYGGNASELLENLIKLIREREQGTRQLRALTGETRMTAIVLGALPLAMAGYFLFTNPGYLLAMWNDGNGQVMLLGAFGLQVVGCLALWRMLRSL